jgi:hypothetical protein
MIHANLVGEVFFYMLLCYRLAHIIFIRNLYSSKQISGSLDSELELYMCHTITIPSLNQTTTKTLQESKLYMTVYFGHRQSKMRHG